MNRRAIVTWKLCYDDGEVSGVSIKVAKYTGSSGFMPPNEGHTIHDMNDAFCWDWNWDLSLFVAVLFLFGRDFSFGLAKCASFYLKVF